MRRSTQSGLSLVELMVGLAVGLLVLAGAGAALADQLGHVRTALVQARLQQDLRAASMLIERDLRRAGHWPAAVQHAGLTAQNNPYSSLQVASDQRSIAYHHGVGDQAPDESLGFRLTQQVLYTKLGAAGWQALTDRQTLRVTLLRFEPQVEAVAAPHACLAGCKDGRCPQAQVRAVHYRIEAQATPPHQHVRHAAQGTVHLRNDHVVALSCL